MPLDSAGTCLIRGFFFAAVGVPGRATFDAGIAFMLSVYNAGTIAGYPRATERGLSEDNDNVVLTIPMPRAHLWPNDRGKETTQ